MQSASRKSTPKNAETDIAAADCEELLQIPLAVEVNAKIMDQPFMSVLRSCWRRGAMIAAVRDYAVARTVPIG